LYSEPGIEDTACARELLYVYVYVYVYVDDQHLRQPLPSLSRFHDRESQTGVQSVGTSLAGKQEHCLSRLSTTIPRSDNVPVENMTDTLVLAPPVFSGSANQDAAEWLRQFTNYCTYKNVTDFQARNLFRVMLTGSAADWFETVVFEEDCVTLDDFKEAFLLRYRCPDVVKYKSARDIFSRKQQEEENVDSFIDKMRKNANIVGMSANTLQLAIVNGLLLHIQNFVLQKEPKTL